MDLVAGDKPTFSGSMHTVLVFDGFALVSTQNLHFRSLLPMLWKQINESCVAF